MKAQQVVKEKRIEFLLKRMEKEPMNCHQMADAVNTNVKCVSKYITELKFKKKIHIHKYERRSGSYGVFYMAGNLPYAPKPVPLSQQEYNKRYKAKHNRITKFTQDSRSFKFIPRMDIAASWMFNPC